MFSAGCSLCRAERVYPVKSAKLGKPPPAEPREARREGAGGAQRRATRSAEGGKDRPHNAKPAGETQHSPQNLSAKRVLPAPRAGEQTIFAFLHWENPLRPGTRNCPFPIRVGEFFVFSLYNRRAPRLRKLPFPNPRGRCPSDFCCPIPACRAQSFFASRLRARFPGEPRSPAPASDEAINSR